MGERKRMDGGGVSQLGPLCGGARADAVGWVGLVGGGLSFGFLRVWVLGGRVSGCWL